MRPGLISCLAAASLLWLAPSTSTLAAERVEWPTGDRLGSSASSHYALPTLEVRDHHARGRGGHHRAERRHAHRSDKGRHYRHDRRGPPVILHHRPPPRAWGPPPRHRWARGDYLPRHYRAPRYVVRDWPGRYPPPPRGYHWVRIDGQTLLVGIATGMILQSIIDR